MQSRGTKGLLSSLRINCADYVGFPPELLALVFSHERLNSEICLLIRGGIIQTVIGHDFTSVADPWMTLAVITGGHMRQPQPQPTRCKVIFPNRMHCPTPKIPLALFDFLQREERPMRSISIRDSLIGSEVNERRKRMTHDDEALNDDYLQFHIGFILDGLPTYRNVTKALGNHQFVFTYKHGDEKYSFVNIAVSC